MKYRGFFLNKKSMLNTLKIEDILKSQYNITAPQNTNPKDYLVLNIHGQDNSNLLNFRINRMICSVNKLMLSRKIAIDKDFKINAFNFFLYPFYNNDISVKEIVDCLFTPNSNEENIEDSTERLLAAYTIYSYASQAESLLNLTNSDYWNVINDGNIYNNKFKWIYIFHLSTNSSNKEIYFNKFRHNMFEYFDTQNKEHEKSLILTNTKFKKIIPEFIKEILSHKNEDSFKLVINYFKELIDNTKKSDDDYEDFMNNLGISQTSFGQIFES